MQSSTAPLRILAVGDIMAGDSPIRFGFGAGTSLAKVGQEAMAKRLKVLLEPADLIIGNLESPLGSISWPLTDYVNHQLLGHTSVSRLLSLAGFNVLNLANNHIMQHGYKRFNETVSVLKAESIGVVGRSLSTLCEPYRITINGLRVAIFGFSLRPEVYATGPLPYAQADSLEKLITAFEKSKCDCDLCIVCLHWGAEYMSYPAPSQRRISEALFESGVDIILGHHPHILQPVEISDGKLVAYSLGNFVFDMWRPRVRNSAVLDIIWNRESGVSVKARPVRIADDGWPEGAPPVTCQINEALGLDGSQISIKMTDSESNYWKRARYAELSNSFHNRSFFLFNSFKYSPTVRTAAVKHFVLRRVKSIKLGMRECSKSPRNKQL